MTLEEAIKYIDKLANRIPLKFFTDEEAKKYDEFAEIVKDTLELRIGYEKSRVDAVEECIDILNDSFPFIANMDIVFGYKCAVERLEQLKEKQNDTNNRV